VTSETRCFRKRVEVSEHNSKPVEVLWAEQISLQIDARTKTQGLFSAKRCVLHLLLAQTVYKGHKQASEHPMFTRQAQNSL